MSDIAYEVNFDGIIGPTHNYSGLSFGNIASMAHQYMVSNPKAAALQGLAKMRALMALGIKQGVLPPHERPFIPILRSLGYEGEELHILYHVWHEAPEILMACGSSANMWAANAATISPSIDSQDHKVHFTPANLISTFHRSFEAPMTALVLQKIFSDSRIFCHHPPLPCQANFADEGAANHTRFCDQYANPGIHLFVFGRSALNKGLLLPTHFPARQTLEASQAIARLHQLPPDHVIFAQQNPKAIDSGVFHNDVISVGNQNVFLYHETAFIDTPHVIQTIQERMHKICKTTMSFIPISENQISLQEVISTYFFNSQLVQVSDGMALIAPIECQYSNRMSAYLNELLNRSDQPIRHLIYQDVRQSMQNGGGPACLRLRVVLNQREWESIHTPVILTENLYHQLIAWVEKHYRDRLVPPDLADPTFLFETRQALDKLTQILQLGSIYSFQKNGVA